MFSDDTEFFTWFVRTNLPGQARPVIEQIRESQPSRRVTSRHGNVSGRYPSRKMRRAIQFESHRNELAAILEMEHDSDVLEYWDQPPSIKLRYEAKSGKKLAVLHTPDYFVIRQSSAGWVECKLEEDLLQLEQRQPNRYRHAHDGHWECPPGEDYAGQYGLSYRVKSSAEIDWVFQRNILFLEDYLRAETLDVCGEVATYIHSLAAAQPGISLSAVLERAKQHDLPADSIYTLIITDRLYADLAACPFTQPEKVRLFLNQDAAAIYSSSYPIPRMADAHLTVRVGSNVQWDGKKWEIINQGEARSWLRDVTGAVIALENSSLAHLVGQNQIVKIPDATLKDNGSDNQTVQAVLAGASWEDLMEANRRYALLTAFQHTRERTDRSITERTLFRWQANYREAEMRCGCGFAGLLPRIRRRGNRARKLPAETLTLMTEYIKTEYENLRQPSIYSVWAKLLRACDERGVIAPSYRTFRLAVHGRPAHQQTIKRCGRRAAYSVEEFHLELDMKTPRHGERPFEIGHIDHTELDIELVCSQTGENLGRPWLTLITDAYSRRFLALYLTFDPPSYRSCMMALRDLVRRFNRLPQTLVLDGGLEFSSVYFEALLARYECTQKIRPSSKARFGSVCERLFGSTNTRFIYNLIGNTQMTKGNVRHITKEVNPKNLAAWTLQQLYERLREYAFEVYDTIQHPALSQSPRDAFLAGQARSGHRSHRYIAANEEFKMLTLPTTNKGTARVIPGRGVKINYIFYWCEGFRDAAVEGAEVPIRYDPFDVGHAYAFIRHHWRQCVSEHYLAFSEHSERELMIGSAEVRQRNKQHGRRFTLTTRKLADFLNSVGAEEAALIHKQRRRDVEARRIALEFEEGTSGRQIHSVPPGSVLTHAGEILQGEEKSVIYRLAADDVGRDLSGLKIYEEY